MGGDEKVRREKVFYFARKYDIIQAAMNIISKKENGVVFTPEWVVDFMTEEALSNRQISGNEKILDAG